MATTNQKPTIDIQKIKRKKHRYNYRKPANHKRGQKTRTDKNCKINGNQVIKWQQGHVCVNLFQSCYEIADIRIIRND